MRDKVLVVGMDGLRFDRITALCPPTLTHLIATGAHGTSLLPYGKPATPRTKSPGEVVRTPRPKPVAPGAAPTGRAGSATGTADIGGSVAAQAPTGRDGFSAGRGGPAAEGAPRGGDAGRSGAAGRGGSAAAGGPGGSEGATSGDRGREIDSRTDSGPGWASILTGVWPDRHGVVDNGFGGARFTKYPDFLTRAKQAKPQLNTSAFFSWAALDEHGAFGLAVDSRFVLDGYAISFMTADKQLAAAAESHLAESDPDLMFVYLGATDEVAHDLGPLCQEYADALSAQDAYLARFIEAVRSRPPYREERWTVIVTTDHGHVDGGGHGGDSAEERGVFVIAARLEEDLGGIRLDGPRLVDVGPTALAQLGIATDPGWDLDGTPFFISR